MAQQPNYIVVEGSIGVGKTTLARRLAKDLGAVAMLEQVDDNPFLQDFYSNPERMGFPTQLHFLMDRIEQLDLLQQDDLGSPRIVADYLLEKDHLFASLNLSEEELNLYRRVYRKVTSAVRVPDLVVYLQAPVSVLLDRVAKRGRRFEKPLDSTYLARINDAYTNFFHYYEESSLLVVNAATINFAENDHDYQALFREIMSENTGRRFFNPISNLTS